jgi:GR25 family glycosyltransferase involved in LPS biosynthesis
MKTKIDIYIIHDSALTERHENVAYIKNLFANNELIANIFVVNKYNHLELKSSEVSSFMKRINEEDNTPQGDLETMFKNLRKPLNLGNVSNYMKHYEALTSIMNSENDAIILEDDVMVSEVFSELFDIEKITNSGYDLVFFGQPFNGKSNETFNKIKNFNDKTLLPTCDSYFVSKNAAESISKMMLPISYSTNISLSYIINCLDLNVAKMFPNLFVDGSKIGKYMSHINTNNICIFSVSYNEMYSMVQSEEPIDCLKFEKLYDEATYKTSPDFIYLKGLYYLKQNKLPEAKLLFDEIFVIYCQNNLALNSSSSFMKNYLTFFKVDQ